MNYDRHSHWRRKGKQLSFGWHGYHAVVMLVTAGDGARNFQSPLLIRIQVRPSLKRYSCATRYRRPINRSASSEQGQAEEGIHEFATAFLFGCPLSLGNLQAHHQTHTRPLAPRSSRE